MGCCHYYEFVEGNESVFAVDPNAIRFGTGVLRQIGHDAQQLGLKRVALFTDRTVRELEPVAVVIQALHAAGVDVVLYDEAHVEPTDQSLLWLPPALPQRGSLTVLCPSAADRLSTCARRPT